MKMVSIKKGIIMIIDTHAHYDDEAFNEDRDALLQSMKEAGVEKIVNIGADLASTKTTVELVKQYDFLYGAVGVHPSNVKELNEENFAWLADQCAKERIVMVGEIGLDYYWDKDNKEEQIHWFSRQLRLAAEKDLPVSIHSRDAAQDTYDVMKEEIEAAKSRGQRIRGILHCYAYGSEMTELFLGLGLYLGIGGVVTFKNAKKLKEVVATMPEDRILLETDCPYLAPEPHRGSRNDSKYLSLVAKQIAELRGITSEEVIEITNRNARELLGL